jgi:hypothetical protein
MPQPLLRLLLLLLALLTLLPTTLAADLTLAGPTGPQCVIVAAPDDMAWPGDSAPLSRFNPHSQEPQRRKHLQRDSIRDLALYLSKLTAGQVQILTTPPATTDTRIPIYVGSLAAKNFGPVGKPPSGFPQYAFRVVVTPKAVGLYGESEYATSYAIYHLLHQLGCRWYMPSDLGESIPAPGPISLPESDQTLAPATLWRRMETRTADPDFRRRNRMGGSNEGGSVIQAQHVLETYITQQQRDANPNWRLMVNGKPHPTFLRWTRQDVADAIADAIIAKLDKDYTPSISLSPGDYVVPTEDPEELHADPSPRVWEPAANQWSVSDRLVLLANRVAQRVNTKYPDVRFGLLVYVNYSMPPARYKLHPSIVPVIAPIDFNRHHPMTWPNHPDGSTVKDMLQGWAKASTSIGYYAYGMNLAELSAPNPFITKWSTDLPIILASNCPYWMPETMGGWESMMPAFYLSTRLTFDPSLSPQPILDELFTRFYPDSHEPMKRYWTRADRAWIDANEFSGCAFGYLRIFTPQVMQGLRADINQALAKCKTITEYRRVQLIDESLTLFELFMKMRRDFADARFLGLATDLDNWQASVRHLRSRYKDQFVLAGLTLDYVDWYFAAPYRDAARVAKQYTPLSMPLLNWKYAQDKDAQAQTLGWTNPDFDDKAWKTAHIVQDTWSSLGFHKYMGHMAYRIKAGAFPLPPGKKAFLWIGATDGSAKLFVNGQHIPYIVPEKTRKNEKGDIIDAFSGFCQPAMFDVTSAIKPGQNQITILCQRTWLNELGTGGLMGPVIIYREK